MAKRRSPPMIKGTMRQWQRDKRRQFAHLKQALETFSFASAYFPEKAYAEFQDARLRLLAVGRHLTKKAWR